MNIDKKAITEAVSKALSEKSERKFNQSVDLSINFLDLDLKKPENRVNVDVALPNLPKGRKVAIFADGEVAFAAQKVADQVISGKDIEPLAKEKKRKKELLKYRLLAQPALMTTIGKHLGQFLSPRGLLPKPLPPNADLKDNVERVRKSVTVRTKNLPVAHCLVGNEKMTVDEIVENILTVLEAVEKKVTSAKIKNVVVKTTMGKPVSVGA